MNTITPARLNQDLIVTRLDKARLLLAECQTVPEAKKIADMAHAAEVYAKRQKLSQESIDYAHAVKIEAGTLLGDFLSTGINHIGGRPPKNPNRSEGFPSTLSESGITYRQSSEAQLLSETKRVDPETWKAIHDNKAPIKKARRVKLRREHRDKLDKAVAAVKASEVEKVCSLRCCTFEALLSEAKPDVIITDPPYPKKYIPLYGRLAEYARNVPLVAVMTGQSYLPEILESMCRFLKYRWTLCYQTPGAALRQWERKIDCAWKPILLFGESEDYVFDMFKSQAPDKDHHEWGQSESGMLDLVRRLTKPGQLVCDPFMGAGTTAIAALECGCRFVGCDIENSCVEEARKRVALWLK